jgi:muramoyltetrapeptide carboxypeptidase
MKFELLPRQAPWKNRILKMLFKAISDLGYKVTLGKHIFELYNQFAGPDPESITDFQEALNDPAVKAFFCARGGYGSIRIIDQLDFSYFRKNPKWIVGFSDITVFHSLLNGYFNIASIHSPMPVNFNSPFFAGNLKQLDNILKGKSEIINIPHDKLNKQGIGKGRLMGGNLSILQNLQATPFEIRPKGAILFIEEVGEQLYHLDRMMQNLVLSGKLSIINGLIVGGMTEMKDKQRRLARLQTKYPGGNQAF